MIKYVFHLILIFLSIQLKSQNFTYYVTGKSDDSFTKALEDSKNYYLLGHQNYDRLNTKPFILKLDKDGNKLEEHHFDTLGIYTIFNDICWAPDSTFIVAGSNRVDSTSNYVPIVLKIDKEFNILWMKKYKATRNENYFFRLRLKNDSSGYILCGNSNNRIQDEYLGIVADINLQGDTNTFKEFFWGNIFAFVFDIIETFDGNYLLITNDAIFPWIPPFSGNNKLIKLNSKFEVDTAVDLGSQGIPLSNKIGMSNNCKMEWLDSNQLMIQGVVNNLNDSNPLDDDRDLGIVLFNYAELNTDTTHAYGNMELWDQSSLYGLSFKDTSNIYTCVTHNFDWPHLFPSSFKSEFFVVKTNSKGISKWEKRFSNGAHTLCYGILATSDGGALIYGSSYLYGYNGNEERDAYLIKIGSNGESQIRPASIEEQNGIGSMHIYPNPSNGDLIVESSDNVILHIYDLNASLIFKKEVMKGINQFSLPLSIPDGMYISQFSNNKGWVSRKLIVKRSKF